MRSAYRVLGIDGNAKPGGDIEVAFRAILATYTRRKLAEDPEAADRLSEVKNAYKVLRSPSMRAAHDRRLAQAVSTEPVSSWVEIPPAQRKPSRSSRVAWILITLVVVICGGYRLAISP